MRRAFFRFQAILAVCVLAEIFIEFHWRSLHAYFGQDELMNIHYAWDPPLWRVALGHLYFWGDFTRPLGAVYYRPLFHWFGFDPVPYNAVRNVLLLVNVTVFFFLARSLCRSWWIATLAAAPIAYHAAMGYIVYAGSFIYDVLCGGFYFAALLYYVKARETNRGDGRGPKQLGVFLALYLLALNSKEMAVSLPVLVLAYEFLYKRRRVWWTPILAGGAITLLFVWGKTGPGTLTDLEGYRPVFTWARFAESNIHFLNEIFYTDTFTMQRVLYLWAILLVIGLRQLQVRRPDPRWMFLWVWIVVTPLPITFLPHRGGPMLYIPVAGWAMLAALALRALAWRLTRDVLFRGLPRRWLMTACLLGCIAAYVHETRRKDRDALMYYMANGQDVRELIADLRELDPPVSGSRIVFMHDPFPNGYATYFGARLFWNDRTLDVHLQQQAAIPQEEIAKAGYIYDYDGGKFIVLKAP